MKSSKKNDLASTLRDAKEYLDYLTEDPTIEPDFRRLHGYLTTLAPCLDEPKKPAELVRTVARLYFETERYQEAAVLLKRFKDPTFNNMQVHCDFYSGYFTSLRDWASRQDEIWEVLEDKVPSLTDANVGKKTQELQKAWDYLFPSDLLNLVPLGEDYAQKGMILPGNRDGIYSLFPMNYLVQHAPDDITEDWSISLVSPATVGRISFDGKTMSLGEIQVRVTPSSGFHVAPKMDLTIWHPNFQPIASDEKGTGLADAVKHLVNIALPTALTTAYVDSITVAREPFGEEEDTVPLDDLDQWFEERDMDPDIPLERILHERVYAFTREPVMVTRPRGDIIRGETCMPELEEIYFLRRAKGMIAFQRYGVGYWFLILPKTVCGEDFPAFQDTLIEAVRKAEGDTVCFTGWAEGTRNCYIDFLSLSNISVLRTLQHYFDGIPGGKNVRISSFYWNSVPRTVDYVRETMKQSDLGLRMEIVPGPVDPPKEQVSAKARANLEKAFRETRWEKLDEDADWDIDAASPYDEAKAALSAAIQHITECDIDDTDYDYVKLHNMLESALPKEDAPGADEDFCDDLSTVLMTVERYRESAKWAARTSPSDERTVRLYTCDVGSDYPNGANQWEPRRQLFWKQFAAAETDLVQFLKDGSLTDRLGAFLNLTEATFPFQEAVLSNADSDKKNTLLTGLPGGILTLPAMLYFISHYPANISKRWNIAIARDGDPLELKSELGQTIATREVQVSLAEKDGKVSLALWHPWLHESSESSVRDAQNAAVRLVNAVLPMGARLLYVADITVAPAEPEESFPLFELRQHMGALGYLPDVSLDTLLSRRRYTISRPNQYNGRPRSDILRGETCMPELERIYNRLYEEGQTILERHGIAAMFLMIPNSLCNGNPTQYRQQLQRYLSQAEGDKVFFTGWAEGSLYCYLDLISMHGRTFLERLSEYAMSNPGGNDLRFCTFYWNSTPRPWNIWDAQKDLASERPEDFARFAKKHKAPDFPVPDAKAAAALEASFHPAFQPEDLCAPKPAEAPAPAAQQPVFGKKKLSKAQRKAQNSKNNQNNKGGKNGKKKR